MRATGLETSTPMPHWLRICVHSAVIVGIFAMHQMMVGQIDSPVSHHVTTVAPAHSSPAVDGHFEGSQPADPAVVHSDDDSQGVMSDCCGLMMLCLSMLAGVGAFIFIRRRSADRVMWQLPPPTTFGISLRLPPFQSLTPLQRTSILRC